VPASYSVDEFRAAAASWSLDHYAFTAIEIRSDVDADLIETPTKATASSGNFINEHELNTHDQ